MDTISTLVVCLTFATIIGLVLYRIWRGAFLTAESEFEDEHRQFTKGDIRAAAIITQFHAQQHIGGGQQDHA